MSDFWNQIQTFAETNAYYIGQQLLKEFGKVQSREKADGSLVTEADEWSDRTLQNAIAETFPDHGILTEEQTRTFPNREWCWVIDPLDGTTNFARGIPVWGVSLGLLHWGNPVFGHVYFPPIQQTLQGIYTNQHQEATINGQPLKPSQDQLTSNHFFSFCSRSIDFYQPPFPCKVRMLGVASYNLLTVAIGSTLGAVEATPKVWDLAGTVPILQAVGVVWKSLGSEPLFPLTPGKDYTRVSCPSLVVAREDLLETFAGLGESLRETS